MVSIYELKLANEKLEALQFLLGELKELEVVLKSLNLNQLKEVETNVTQSAQSANLIKNEIERYLFGFETKKQDFDKKYSEISILFEQLKQLKGQIEGILQNGLISDNTVSPITAYSSQKIEQIKSAIDDSIQALGQTLTQIRSQMQNASQSISSLNQQVADRYAKSETYSQTEINERLQNISIPLATETKAGIVKLKKRISGTAEDATLTEKALVESFVNKSAFSAYGSLPRGDMSTKEYWQKIPSGLYWFNADGGGYTNPPANYAHFFVLRHPDSKDLQVICFQHLSNIIKQFKASADTTISWEPFNKNLGEGQRWTDVKSQRQTDVIYTNATGRVIKICVTATVPATTGSTAGISLDIDGTKMHYFRSGTSTVEASQTISEIIQPNQTYRVSVYGSSKITSWQELR